MSAIYFAAYVPIAEGKNRVLRQGSAIWIPSAIDATKCTVKTDIGMDVVTTISGGVPRAVKITDNAAFGFGKDADAAVCSLFMVVSADMQAERKEERAALDEFFEDVDKEFAYRKDYRRGAEIYKQISSLPHGFTSSCNKKNACPSISAKCVSARDKELDSHFVCCDVWIKADNARPMPCVKGDCKFTLQVSVGDKYYFEYGSDSWNDILKQAPKAIGLQKIVANSIEETGNRIKAIKQNTDAAEKAYFEFFQRDYPRWIVRWHSDNTHVEVCPECGAEFGQDSETGVSISDYNYCPNCGEYLNGTSSAHRG